MTSVVVVGAQWGDEGKGKVVDRYAERAGWVLRFQGGNNAGHTLVVQDETTVLHLVPSGILQPKAVCGIGNGVVVDPEILLDEIDMLEAKNIDLTGRLWVSHGAHLILPYHKRLDLAREATRGVDKIGTTGRGIGPAYEDKIARRGVRMADLFDKARLQGLIRHRLFELNAILAAHNDLEPYGPDEIDAMTERYLAYGQRLKPYLANLGEMLHQAIQNGESVLFEGAQGVMLDVDHGTYPFVTSSNTVASAAATGTGQGPGQLHRIVGITKAYTTRVGAGPFPTELFDESGEALRKAGHEFGATTGRARRTGWLDLVALAYAARVGGVQTLAITKLDVLAQLDRIKVCVAYELDGQRLTRLPDNAPDLARVVPIYQEMPAIEDPSQARSFDELGPKARAYLEFISETLSLPICLVSVGPGRDEAIEIADPFKA